jgi:hypothetical protein
MGLMEAAVEVVEAITMVMMEGVWQPLHVPDRPSLPVELPRP